MESKQSYFPHDSNARNSEKLIRLRMRHKAAGYGVFFMILERLREEPNYMSVKDYNVIAFDLREDASLIKSVVEDFGLFVFTEDGKYFYSESFSRRMGIKDDEKAKRSEAGKKGMARRWENAKKSTENPVENQDVNNSVITELSDNDNNDITTVENSITSKVKKSKVKNNKEKSPKGDTKKDKLSLPTPVKNEPVDFVGLQSYFNETFKDKLPMVANMTEARRKAVKARIAEYDKNTVFLVLQKVLASPFLLGCNDRNWKCDFDWIFKAANFTKILEGNYDEKRNNNTAGGRKESVSRLKDLAEAILTGSET
ncbi:Lin1244/Lin1753 domain-containing protein [uncultured Bacteroides sp.]|uniref:Lin1244/Lin1753 domain-containing protein n=1 Tax=uncultured Bacteroides sp. TaxID=162156 RepID=UPI002611A89D|nr:Lin1244/Lin1753 domain-containing protein [uncultured Bacteroides sp.]